MTEWTPSMVEERLIEAAAILRRLPTSRTQGYFTTWPAMVVEFCDLVGQTPEPMRRGPPSAAAISRMEVALTWVQWLECEDAKLLWMRAERKSWKEICWRFGIARATANLRMEYALSVIVWKLNRRPLPSKWSRRFLVNRVRFLSREF